MPKRKLPQTSLDAKASLQPDQIRAIYQKILASLSVLGEATFEEIAAHAKLEKSKVWRRMNELMKDNLVYRPGNKRPLRSGRNGFTWMCTDKSLPKVERPQEKAMKGESVADYSRKLIPTTVQAKMF